MTMNEEALRWILGTRPGPARSHENPAFRVGLWDGWSDRVWRAMNGRTPVEAANWMGADFPVSAGSASPMNPERETDSARGKGGRPGVGPSDSPPSHELGVTV